MLCVFSAGLSSGAVVGVIVAVLILIVIIVVAVMFFLKYKRGECITWRLFLNLFVVSLAFKMSLAVGN